MRRVVYALLAILLVNLAFMGGMYVDTWRASTCDVDSRGLAVWNEERRQWKQVVLPHSDEDSDLPPCRTRVETELVMLPPDVDSR